MAEYTTRFRCMKCKGYLSDQEYRFNEGTCPGCGHRRDSQFDTYVDAEAIVGKWVWIGPWWMPRFPWARRWKWVLKEERK